MNVLITVDSKHGSTMAIAETIAKTLRDRDHQVALRAPAEIESIAEYDAFALGSAVYAGRWRRSIRDFARRFAGEFAPRPVWLFSSGPVGSVPKPSDTPSDIATIADNTGAMEHRVFAGALERDRLNLGERAIVKLVRAPYGDYRYWDEIRSWARMIADDLTPVRDHN